MKTSQIVDKALSTMVFLVGMAAEVFAPHLTPTAQTLALVSVIAGIMGITQSQVLAPILAKLENDFLASSQNTSPPQSQGGSSPTSASANPFVPAGK